MQPPARNRKQKITDTLAKAGLDSFLLALIGMIVLAYFFPYPGTSASPFYLAAIANYAVSLIFFFYGLRLSPTKLRAGLGNWRLHTVIHLTTFVLFPLLVLSLRGLFIASSAQTQWLAVFYLSALPSTVSSSVVMVSIAGGNLPGAIFNASISSLLSVFLTPLWMGLFLQSGSGGFDPGPVIGKLVLQVLVPVTLGILLNARWGGFAERHKKHLSRLDQTIILLIVYTSFCESFAEGVFHSYRVQDIFWLGLGMLGLFFMLFFVVRLISHLLHFNREDRITALFCGSKKSLVHGTVMSGILFPDAAVAGVMLLPLMLYHTLQLLAASIIAQAMARQKK